jgi:hypothetical protein
LWHADYERFFSKAQQLEFFAEARRAGVVPVVILLSDPRDRFVVAYEDLQEIGDIEVVLVRNRGLGKEPRATAAPFQLELPRLDDITLRALIHPNILVHRIVTAESVTGSRGMQAFLKLQLETFLSRLAELNLRLALNYAAHI